MLAIYVVSDATGETVERIVRSALVQFEKAPAKVVRRGHVRTPEQLRELVREAAHQNSLILHTLVSHELRRLMLTESRLVGVDAMDLMGPTLDRLATHLGLTPQEKPGLFKQLVEDKSRQVEAVEFAFRHDDGQQADELRGAEVVLVGVSRTMKTPTALYLAYKGWFAANVPIIPEIPLPSTLLSLPAERVFCLTMATGRLLELRRVRADRLEISATSYTSPQAIQREVRHCHLVCADHGWQRIDVTAKSVEEVAQEIVGLVPKDPSDPSRASRPRDPL